MIVYCLKLQQRAGKMFFSSIFEKDLPEDSYNKFKWDRIVRIDFLQEECSVFYSDKKELILACSTGMAELIDLNANWNKIFSQENNNKLLESIKNEK